MAFTVITRPNFGFHCAAHVAIVFGLLCVGIADADDGDALFENSIRPVLVGTCFGCHGDAKVSGMLRVDSRESLLKGGESGASIVPNMPDESLLIRAIQRHEDVSAMPPDADKALRPEQIAAFKAWIQGGANWPTQTKKFEVVKHWAFEPLNADEPPVLLDENVNNPIDVFIRAKQVAAGVRHAAPADKLTLIRRATFDLTGLPPTLDEVSTFLDDQTSTAYASLIERLLDSPDYGRRWGRHWLDVVRYADTAGETADFPAPLAWRYRNYVIDSFNDDKPYDQFLREQIAGDILAQQGPTESYAEQVTATGYLAISRRFGFDSENYHHLTIQDTIDTLGQSVLGLSLGCARCHDHKFDQISMTDYYGLYAIFDSSRYAFPGSEQKQKFRSLVPLLPPSEAIPKWREFDQRVAVLADKLDKAKLPVPSAILRSLNDMDGDFEMQAPAAGGSNGVLVPPWLYQGKIAVTNAAQSPYKNLYASGKVGASISADAGNYRVAQSLHLSSTATACPSLHANLDFRVTVANTKATGAHRIWIGSQPSSPAILLTIAADSVSMQVGTEQERIADIKPQEWHNLQLTLNLAERTVSGTVGTASGVNAFDGKFSPSWTGAIDLIVIESANTEQGTAPAIEFDNLGIQVESIPSAFKPSTNSTRELDPATLSKELLELIGMDGDFEYQSDGEAPSIPWNAGPNSVVKAVRESQSPYQNLYPTGEYGIYMPNRGEYDGFGLTLSQSWNADKAERLYASFDFCCAENSAGGDGSWRYYVGHGPGSSAAVELFFNANQFFRRSGDLKEPVCDIHVGEWYQVQLEIDLKAKTYSGLLRSTAVQKKFHGDLASGWDGTIDNSFIDSYGHIGGVRPSVKVDNYLIRDSALPESDAEPTSIDEEGYAVRHNRARVIKQQLSTINKEAQQAAQELNSLLADGPFAMTYGMAEGTPHSVPIQLRGEPSQPGELVQRGFVRVLGGESLPNETAGSGRLELAQWITRPDNPLTARVMVNRIWQYHFGHGLVKTPNDFGVRGLPPTHPALLDYLATQFISSGWSVKTMHRLIMSSATYQQSSQPVDWQPTTPTVTVADDLYTHFNRRRLTAEEIRDSILAVSSELDREPGNEHPFPSQLNWGFTQHGPFNAVYDHNKRSVYLMTQRIKRHPFLSLFDGPDPNATTPNRLGTTVPTQALFFLNDPFVYGKSDSWAKRILASGTSEDRQIDLAYQTAFSRPAMAEERAEATAFLAAYRSELSTIGQNNPEVGAMAALLRTLVGSNEFLHVD